MKNYEVFLLLILVNATVSYFLNRNPNNNQKYLNDIIMMISEILINWLNHLKC